jgi:SAM-dependent methyltransferase
MTIDYFSLNHPLRMLASRISFHVRLKIFSSFMEIMKPDLHALILDIGVTPDQKLPESNFFESLYPYKDRIVATSIENASFLEETYPGIAFIQTEKDRLPFKDQTFDIVFCSAVLEHVGDRDHQSCFIRELLRVSRKFFIITPNRQFPVEFHTFLPVIHWLPQPLHQSLLKKLQMDFWSRTQNLNLHTPHSLLSLFPSHTDVHLNHVLLLGFPSNLIAFGNCP